VEINCLWTTCTFRNHADIKPLEQWFLTFTNTPNPYVVFQALVEPHCCQITESKNWLHQGVFQRRFRGPIRVPRISENCHRVPTGYLTFSLKTNLATCFRWPSSNPRCSIEARWRTTALEWQLVLRNLTSAVTYPAHYNQRSKLENQYFHDKRVI